jgi:hypothetical protein
MNGYPAILLSRFHFLIGDEIFFNFNFFLFTCQTGLDVLLKKCVKTFFRYKSNSCFDYLFKMIYSQMKKCPIIVSHDMLKDIGHKLKKKPNAMAEWLKVQ